MEYFVGEHSIVRKIWGKSDTVLFIFAGAAAEFALNKAVDWLYFTGRLPADPIGRLFSTVSYAHRIIFSDLDGANRAIDKITSIHSAVESARGAKIPDWAYRDVLFMLIHYSIASFELLERKLSEEEKEEVYQVFYRLGLRMHLKDLPPHYQSWLPVRMQHMEEDLRKSDYSIDLFKQYKRSLGASRYAILKEAQMLVIPERVRELLDMRSFSLLRPAVPFYKFSRIVHLDGLVKAILLPSTYKKQISELDRES
ncbi:MAG: oxygenase MpaB family protein [Flavisolibacter sp.]